MNNSVWHASGGRRNEVQITICPNALLGLGVFLALVFSSYLGRNGAMIFLIMGILLMGRRLDLAFRDIREYWWLCLLPLWAFVSTVWSEYPALSMRHGTQLLITFMIAISLANRLSPILLLRMLFVALLFAGFASLGIGDVRDDGIWIGIFESKNFYAFTMVSLVLCSFAFMVDRAQTLLWRIAGFGGAVLGLPQVFMAEAIGAVIASIVVLLVAVVLLRIRSLPPERQNRRMFLLTSLALVGFVVSMIFLDTIMDLVLEGTGKDPSLTGRTDLWAAAIEEVYKAPIFGAGYRAFWVHGNSTAEMLWADFYIGSRSGFHFHNLYLSNWVEIGLIGVALQVLLLVSGFLLCVRWLLKVGGAAPIFFFMVVSFVIVLSFVEVPVFFEFDTLSVMTLAAIVYGLRVAREIPQFHRPQHVAWPA